MDKVGFVKRIIDDNAELEIRRSSACGSCKGCIGSSSEVKAHVITLKNNIDAKVGDLVEIKGETKNVLKYMFIIYMIPFVFLVGGIVIGNGYFKAKGFASFELLSFGVGLITLFISFFIVKSIDNKIAKSNKNTIVMTRILE